MVSGIKFLAAVVWLSAAWLGCAQTASPAGVHLTIRTRDGRTSFSIGETIPLELVFSTDVPQQYQISAVNYDYNGRSNYETVAVQPRAAWTDPLSLYFRSGGFAGGAAPSYFQPLTAQPTIVPIDLNQWIRFDKPGDYRVTVTSNRVTFASQPQRIAPVLSNDLPITLTVPTSQWQQDTLKNALSAIDNPATHGLAAKALRYLGTEAAAREMARRSTDPDCRFGLVGSPYRDAALEEMRKLMRDPATPIERQFLETMAFLSVPDTPGAHYQDTQEKLAALQQELVAALSSKSGPALTASVRTMLENPRGITPDLRLNLVDLLYANFDKLSLGEQSDLLRNPNTAPERIILIALVRKMATREQQFTPAQAVEAASFNRIVGDALMQWYSLDPDGARPAILREILKPQPRFSADVLGILPEKALSDAEKPLLDHFASAAPTDRAAIHNLATLIARYVTAGPEADLLARLDRDVAAGLCDTQAPMLAWLMRVDAPQATARLEKATKAGAPCRVSLHEIAKLQQNPLLEPIAIKSLEDPDPVAVSDAASYLTDYGTAAAEEPLWAAYTTWSKHWTGQEQQLNTAPQDLRVGQSLFQALLMGNGWLMDLAKLQRLASLAASQNLRQMAEQYFRIWENRPWLVRAAGLGQYQVGWYHAVSIVAAKRKIAQFPKGTEFRWIMQGLPTDSADFKELAQFAAGYGIRLW